MPTVTLYKEGNSPGNFAPCDVPKWEALGWSLEEIPSKLPAVLVAAGDGVETQEEAEYVRLTLEDAARGEKIPYMRARKCAEIVGVECEGKKVSEIIAEIEDAVKD